MKSVLIVDDEERAAYHLGRALESRGLKTFLAFNGEDGLVLFQQEKPDFVLLDINLPKKTGIEVLQEIRLMNPRARVLMVSGESDEGVCARAKSFGACGFLAKPLDIHSLFSLADRFLEWGD